MKKLKHYKRKEIKIVQSMVQKLTTVYMYVQVLVYISAKQSCDINQTTVSQLSSIIMLITH